jgi:hypothetical protein
LFRGLAQWLRIPTEYDFIFLTSATLTSGSLQEVCENNSKHVIAAFIQATVVSHEGICPGKAQTTRSHLPRKKFASFADESRLCLDRKEKRNRPWNYGLITHTTTLYNFVLSTAIHQGFGALVGTAP